jgi:hypothetical protein
VTRADRPDELLEAVPLLIVEVGVEIATDTVGEFG